MSEESTTSDTAELTRQHYAAADRRDFDALMSPYGPDPVWDTSAMGLGIYEGAAAIRGFFEDWIEAYEDWEIEGVVFEFAARSCRVYAPFSSRRGAASSEEAAKPKAEGRQS